MFPSIAGHVKSCENLPRPWGKAKYYLMNGVIETESELNKGTAFKITTPC